MSWMYRFHKQSLSRQYSLSFFAVSRVTVIDIVIQLNKVQSFGN